MIISDCGGFSFLMASNYTEIGVSGLEQYSGYIHEEVLSELNGSKWRDTLKRMLVQDSTVCALNFLIEMMIRQAVWKIDAADETPEAEEIRQFFENALFEDLSQDFQSLLAEIVSFVGWGYSIHEIVYKRREDGRIGWKRFAGRSQDSLDHWQFDKEDYADAFIQRSPNMGEVFTIPLAKCLHFRTSTVKNNPEGRSIYRGGYRAWYFKTRLENVEAIGTERDLAGMPVMYVPEQIMKSDASAGEVALRNTLLDTLKSIRRDQNEGVMMPAKYDANGNLLFKLELLSTGGSRQFDTDKIINRYRAEILSVALADFMMLGSQTVTGSYSLSTDKTELFCTAIEAFLDVISAQFNNKAFQDLGKLNGIKPELLPKLNHGEIDKKTVAEIYSALDSMVRAGFQFDAVQENWFKQKIGMPATVTTDEQ